MIKLKKTQQQIADKIKFLDHYCYLKIGGRFDRMVFYQLMLQGIDSKSWVVQVNIKKIVDSQEVLTKAVVSHALKKFVKDGTVQVVGKGKEGTLYLIPDLAEFVIPGWDEETRDHNPVNEKNEINIYG